jgi:hypothetical protein
MRIVSLSTGFSAATVNTGLIAWIGFSHHLIQLSSIAQEPTLRIGG